MNLLIDTNVLLDMVFTRNDYEKAMTLFKVIRESNSRAFVSASAVTDLFYIIRRETHDTAKTYSIMENIFKLIEVVSVTERDIYTAFTKQWKDFEDCVQYTVAERNDMDYFVTSNQKDFEDGAIMVVSPEKCVEILTA